MYDLRRRGHTFYRNAGGAIREKWLMGAGVGLAAVSAASFALTRELVSVAVDREYDRPVMEKARRKFARENALFVAHMDRMALKLRRAPTETVRITAGDGAQLVGHWYPCEDARRIVIAMHGWRSRWDQSFGLVADFLRKSGCSVLYAEQRCHGQSGGEYMGLGALERYDCQSWAAWAAAKSRLPIYLAGVSMGATTVLMAAGLPLPAQVKGVIADCGFTSPEAIGKFVVQHNLHLSYAHRAAVADALCRRKNQVGLRGASSVEALKKSRLPVLLIHGAEDSIVPVTMSYENYRACAGPKELLIVPGADHGMSYFVDKSRYENALKRFWEQYDP